MRAGRKKRDAGFSAHSRAGPLMIRGERFWRICILRFLRHQASRQHLRSASEGERIVCRLPGILFGETFRAPENK